MLFGTSYKNNARETIDKHDQCQMQITQEEKQEALDKHSDAVWQVL